MIYVSTLRTGPQEPIGETTEELMVLVLALEDYVG